MILFTAEEQIRLAVAHFLLVYSFVNKEGFCSECVHWSKKFWYIQCNPFFYKSIETLADAPATGPGITYHVLL